ncbi:RNA-binding transcriptional accessory protein [candidate division WOR-3 bacterium]|nr:RNA-binding transcriptional accessory protein [candidate division WOR-3 bacterium]
MNKIEYSIIANLNLPSKSITNTISLLDEGATYPFIARYRKELTGGLNEVQIEKIDILLKYYRELNDRKETILKSIAEQDKLTDELRAKIENCNKKAELEDLYLPYKPKRRTKATIAIEKGLEPVAIAMLSKSFQDNRNEFLSNFIDKENDLNTIEDVIDLAAYIIIEQVKEDADIRNIVRTSGTNKGIIISLKKKNSVNKRNIYENYYEYNEPVKSIPSHRYLAINRGEREKILTLKIEFPTETNLNIVNKKYINNNIFSDDVSKCCKFAMKQIELSVETEIRNELFDRSSEEAINVFRKNLKTLLMQSPAGEVSILGIDPGIRTGSKYALIDQQGNLVKYGTIYTEKGTQEKEKAKKEITELLKENSPEYIAIGNGTYSREIYDFITNITEDNIITSVPVIVNESGASVYSGSQIGRDEFPKLDITIRGAISIARRLQDPLSELVKIDPKSIGVGQYQHDVNQKMLKKALDDTIISCVNKVGVNVNTASWTLLKYVSGFNENIAKKFANFRERNGKFSKREEFKKISYFTNKVFELSAGFLRISDGNDVLDASAIHPESYDIVYRIAKDLKCNVKELLGNSDLTGKIDPKKYTDDKRGLPTVKDIISELEKPGGDPRSKFIPYIPDSQYRSIEDLKIDLIIEGTVTNVTNFGAFIDIGVHQDGLCHISEVSNKYIKNIEDVLHPGDRVKVRIIDLDIKRKRISLSIKQI